MQVCIYFLRQIELGLLHSVASRRLRPPSVSQSDDHKLIRDHGINLRCRRSALGLVARACN